MKFLIKSILWFKFEKKKFNSSSKKGSVLGVILKRGSILRVIKFLWLVLKRIVQSLWVIFFKKGFNSVSHVYKGSNLFFWKKSHVVKGVGPFLSEFVEKKAKVFDSNWKKKFHLPSHKKAILILGVKKNLQKGSILWVIFLGKKPTFLWRKFNSLSQIFENPVQSFESSLTKGLNSLRYVEKKSSILWVTFQK